MTIALLALAAFAIVEYLIWREAKAQKRRIQRAERRL